MRKFTSNETRFIVEHQDTLELGMIAQRLKCDWHEVYAHYDQVTKTEAYRKFVDKRREGGCLGGRWKEARFVIEEEEPGGEEPSDEFCDTPSADFPNHLADSVYYQDYRSWKRSQNNTRDCTSSIRKPSDVFNERIFHRED